MHAAFTEEQRDIQTGVHDALASECTPARVRAAWDEPDAELRALLAELGILGIGASEEVGGLGLGMADQVLVHEELGRFAAPVAAIETTASNPTLAELGWTDLLGRVVAGEAFVTVLAPAGYALDADLAEVVLTVSDGAVCRVVNPVLERQQSVDGARRIFSVRGELERLEADAQGMLDRGAVAAAAQLIGLSRAMLDSAVEYSKSRRQFGKPIGSFQAVQHHLVDALLKVAFAAPLAGQAAWALDAGLPNAAVSVSMAKLYASEAAELTARKALQVHGAIGYTFEYDLHLWMKRSWALARAWGDARHHETRVATHVLGAEHA